MVRFLVVAAYVDVDYVIVGGDQRGDRGRMERGIEDVAVVAPIAAENHEHILVIFRGGCQSRIEVLLRFAGIRIEIRVGDGGLRQAHFGAEAGVAALRGGDFPAAFVVRRFARAR